MRGFRAIFRGIVLPWGSRSCVRVLAQEGTPFQDTWKQFLDSLPRTSFLLVAVSLVDLGLVIAYCAWSVNRPAGAIEESLHIAVALGVRAKSACVFIDPLRPPPHNQRLLQHVVAGRDDAALLLLHPDASAVLTHDLARSALVPSQEITSIRA